MAKILVVDDEKSIRVSLREFLKDAGYPVGVAADADLALEMLEGEDFDVVVADIILPGPTGVSLLRTIKEASPEVQVILMTGEPTIETAAEAARFDAFDYVPKPIKKERLLKTVSSAANVKALDDERRRLAEENRRYQENLEQLVEQRTKSLRDSEEQYRTLVENVPVGIYRTTPDGQILAANPTLVRILGYDSLEQLQERDLNTMGFGPEDPRTRFLERIERHGQVTGFESTWLTRDGSPILIRENAVAVRDAEGSTLYYEGAVEDITKQREL